MNQEIEQTVTENKKPRMYVSWRITLVYLLIIAGAFFCWYLIYKAQIVNYLNESKTAKYAFSSNVGKYEEVLNGIGFPMGIFVVGEILILLSVFIRKPLGFVRVKLINIIAGSPLIVILFLIILSPVADGLRIGTFLRSLSPGLLFFVFVFFINRRFQKSEIELSTAQS